MLNFLALYACTIHSIWLHHQWQCYRTALLNVNHTILAIYWVYIIKYNILYYLRGKS